MSGIPTAILALPYTQAAYERRKDMPSFTVVETMMVAHFMPALRDQKRAPPASSSIQLHLTEEMRPHKAIFLSAIQDALAHLGLSQAESPIDSCIWKVFYAEDRRFLLHQPSPPKDWETCLSEICQTTQEIFTAKFSEKPSIASGAFALRSSGAGAGAGSGALAP